MKKICFLLGCVVHFSLPARAGDEKPIIKAKLVSVIVYTSGAGLSHQASANLRQGSYELIVENVSHAINEETVQIKAAPAVTVLGVKALSFKIGEDNNDPNSKALKDSIAALEKAIAKVQGQIDVNKDLNALLSVNREVKGSQTGLNVAELAKLMDFYRTKDAELKTEQALLLERQTKLREALEKAKAELSWGSGNGISGTGKLVIKLSVAQSGSYPFEINYISPNAHWTPIYDIRAEDIKKPLKLVYKALVSQTTGIEWKQVKLSLSTNVPGQNGQAPVLNPWFVDFPQPVLYGASRKMQKANLSMAPAYAGAPMAAMSANDELAPTTESHVATVNEGNVNFTFDIDLPYDLANNEQQQTVVLTTHDVPARFKYVAVPKLDKDVYLIAEVAEWESLNLLPGTANVIMEGTYMGKTFIDPSSTQDTLTLTIGADKRVTVKREKLRNYSSKKFLGSTKQQQLAYEVTVKNNKRDPIELELKDQFPVSNNKEIEVELTESTGASVDAPQGLLNWKLIVAPNEGKKIKFGYSVKIPKDKTLNLN